ncbi:hypothetical protein ACFLR2_01305 [Chlamydiota bacterium]
MSLAVRATFSSSLSSDSHFFTFLGDRQAQYRLLKAADPLLDTIGEIAKLAHAPQESLKGIAYARMGLRTVRDLLGISHIFFSVIPALIYSLGLLFRLCYSFFTAQDVQLHPTKRGYATVAKGSAEKMLCIAALTAQCAKSGSSAFAFCVCQPLLYLQITSGVKLGERLQAVGGAFQTLMLVKHSSGLLAGGLEMAYHYSAFQRTAIQERDYSDFSKKIIQLAAGIIENGLQLLYDIAKTLQTTVPAGFRLPLTCTIAGVGLYKTWLKTA